MLMIWSEGIPKKTGNARVKECPWYEGTMYRRSWSLAPYDAPIFHIESLYSVNWMSSVSSGSNRALNEDYAEQSELIKHGPVLTYVH